MARASRSNTGTYKHHFLNPERHPRPPGLRLPRPVGRCRREPQMIREAAGFPPPALPEGSRTRAEESAQLEHLVADQGEGEMPQRGPWRRTGEVDGLGDHPLETGRRGRPRKRCLRSKSDTQRATLGPSFPQASRNVSSRGIEASRRKPLRSPPFADQAGGSRSVPNRRPALSACCFIPQRTLSLPTDGTAHSALLGGGCARASPYVCPL
jgi:hypothetical protein